MMREVLTEGLVYVEDDLGLRYSVAKVSYCEWEDGRFEYRFEPNYGVIDLLDASLFQGIPGLDLSLRKTCYMRDDRTPVFIAERTPDPRREDLVELLEACDMEYLNRLEWLIRTDTRYTGDHLLVRRWESADSKRTLCASEVYGDAARSALKVRRLLEAICAGHDVIGDGFVVTDENRRAFHRLLRDLYRTDGIFRRERREEGVRRARAAGKYRGRKPVALDVFDLDRVCRSYLAKEITAAEAAEELGVSVATFRRRLKRAYPEGRSDKCIAENE